MTVTLEHRGTAGVVVHGIDTTEALTHLCRSLAQGEGLDARVVVIDLTDQPFLAQTTSATIGAAAAALARMHRWLGVVEPLHAAATEQADAWYATSHAALAAGTQYLSFLDGQEGGRSWLGMPFAAASNLLSWLPEVSLAATRALWRRLRGGGPSSDAE